MSATRVVVSLVAFVVMPCLVVTHCRRASADATQRRAA
jgi:hypothetical protein